MQEPQLLLADRVLSCMSGPKHPMRLLLASLRPPSEQALLLQALQPPLPQVREENWLPACWQSVVGRQWW